MKRKRGRRRESGGCLGCGGKILKSKRGVRICRVGAREEGRICRIGARDGYFCCSGFKFVICLA